MRLSDAARGAEVSIVRDGEFRNLGFLPDDQDDALVFLESPRFGKACQRIPGISAVVTTPELAGQVPRHLALGLSATPREAFANIHNYLACSGFYWDAFATLIDLSAGVHRSAWVAESSVRIGGRSAVGPHATILERCSIGIAVEIGAGAILGGVGFQTVRSSRPMLELRHAGGLTIHDRARILPGAIIATGLFRRPTEIGEDVRVGSLAFISHGVRVGARAFVGHGAVVNGNVTIGEDAWIGPGAVIANGVSIGDGASVTLGSVVTRDVAAGRRVSGNFAIAHKRLLRALAAAESERGTA